MTDPDDIQRELKEIHVDLSSGAVDAKVPPPALADSEARTWGMALHLSLLLPVLGLVVPFVIWLIKKEELPGVDLHGRIAANWVVSAFVYGLISKVLTIVFIGKIGLALLAIAWVIFPIVAALQAHQGVAWRYPLSIRVFG